MGKRFRTLFAIYFAFLMLDFTSSDQLFPNFVYVAMSFYTNFWHWIVPWTGEHILHLPYKITVRPNGSGDTTYNYVLQLLWTVFAIIIAMVWAVADRRRPSYHQFRYWCRIVIRYFLAYMLFVYGFIKVIKLQFPFPDLVRLTEPYGESTPMGLAWTFVGYSSGYNLYIGSAEVLAGLLLLFKRTTLMGGLLAMAVMANVVVMNFAYDIPVKIFSLNLLFMATWITWYDIDRLIAFFLLNKSVQAQQPEYPFKSKWKKISQYALKILFISLALYSTLWTSMSSAKQYGELAAKPPLYGIYDIESFSRQGQLVPPLASDSSRWKRMIINYPGYVRITNMTDSLDWMQLALDTSNKWATFISTSDSTDRFTLQYQQPDLDHLVFAGAMRNDSIRILMRRFDINKFPLVNTGFHWINEYPNNR